MRGRDEFATSHARGAINRPLPDITGGSAALPDDKDAPVVTFCKVGERSLHAMLLTAMGYSNVKSVHGGINAWTAAGLPTEADDAALR